MERSLLIIKPDGLQVQDIPFHKDGSLLLVKRGDIMLVPHAQTYFMMGDIVIVFGTGSALKAIKSKLS